VRQAAAAAAVAICVLTGLSAAGSQLVVREVYLMGTRARLAAIATTREEGLATLDAALTVLERTESDLSTWRESSDISALNRHPVGTPWHAREPLCRMFSGVWAWHRLTAGAFDPGIGRLLAAWGVHEEGALPDAATLERTRAASGLSLFTFDAQGCTVTRQGAATLDVGAFGKGEALDRVNAALGDAVSWMIDLGGQVSAGGRPLPDGWTISIADPRDRTRPFTHARLRGGSLSTSGGSERDVTVNGTRVSHILDPRTGRPAAFTGSVSVWHRSGLAADALSTALFVMGPEEGLRFAERHRLAALYLIPDAGAIRVRATAAFAAAIELE